MGGGRIDRGQDRLRSADVHEWVKKAEVNSGKRAGVPTEVADRVKALERKIRELRQAIEILRKASPYFAQGEAAQAMRGMAENRTLDRRSGEDRVHC